jgi:hypothetical protein
VSYETVNGKTPFGQPFAIKIDRGVMERLDLYEAFAT